MAHDTLTVSDRLAKQRTELAAKRTVMAAERSLMAWIRTSLSMIGFGFTIYAFLQSLIFNEKFLVNIKADSPRMIGMFLLGLGILANIFGSMQYLFLIKKLKQTISIKASKFPLFFGTLIGLLGVILFLSLFVKIHFL